MADCYFQSVKAIYRKGYSGCARGDIQNIFASLMIQMIVFVNRLTGELYSEFFEDLDIHV